MKINRGMYFAAILSVCLFVLWGCPKGGELASETEPPREETAAAPEEQKAEPAAEEPKTEPVKEEAKEEPKAEPVKEEPKAEPVKEEPHERAAAATKGLQPVYFDFDKAFVREDARPVMKENAEWLKANPKVKVRIEGNCDERGTKEYNQALGQRRAASAKKYLTDLGIAASRISLISYGKEKQICNESNEECWQKNRRDDLAPAE